MLLIQSQQSLLLECNVCAEQYGPDFNNNPRSLKCGHTFCTGCLMKLITPRGVTCPMCNTLHPLPNPDVALLPINYAVQDIIQANSNPPPVDVEQCDVCSTSAAKMICIDCQPGSQFKFCENCDKKEHSRPFPPVQRHRRFPIDPSTSHASSTVTCLRHATIAATLYSQSLHEFACSTCTMDADWESRSLLFESCASAAQKMRYKVQKMTKYTNEVTKRLTGARQDLESIMKELEPKSLSVKADITRTFTQCIDKLQERQRVLLDNIDNEVSLFFYIEVVYIAVVALHLEHFVGSCTLMC